MRKWFELGKHNAGKNTLEAVYDYRDVVEMAEEAGIDVYSMDYDTMIFKLYMEQEKKLRKKYKLT